MKLSRYCHSIFLKSMRKSLRILKSGENKKSLKVLKIKGLRDFLERALNGGIVFPKLNTVVRFPSPAPCRSKLDIACSDLFYKLERAHTAALLFQT